MHDEGSLIPPQPANKKRRGGKMEEVDLFVSLFKHNSNFRFLSLEFTTFKLLSQTKAQHAGPAWMRTRLSRELPSSAYRSHPFLPPLPLWICPKGATSNVIYSSLSLRWMHLHNFQQLSPRISVACFPSQSTLLCPCSWWKFVVFITENLYGFTSSLQMLIIASWQGTQETRSLTNSLKLERAQRHKRICPNKCDIPANRSPPNGIYL